MRALLLAGVVIISACSDGNSIDTLLLDPEQQPQTVGDRYDPDGPVVNACESPYFLNLRGDYDGQIVYQDLINGEPVLQDDGTPKSCTWEVELQVSGVYESAPVNRMLCELRGSMTSQLLSGSEDCADVGLAGDIVVPSALDTTQLSTPAWPVDGSFILRADLPAGEIYPVGRVGTTSLIRLRFDGMGNISYPNNNTNNIEWTGVLVKQ